MTTDYVLVAIFVAVFFVGFGVGSAVFYNQPNMPILGHGMTSHSYSPHEINQIMDNPESHQPIMDSMMDNPEFMNKLMENQNFMQRLNP